MKPSAFLDPNSQHHWQDLVELFNRLFAETENTCLVKGDDEPIYLPADDDNPQHRVVFAHGFYASALHEIAHWCIAGKQRRLLEDYGYWYCPDGRDQQQQAAFEQVEAKPQAIEWAFCVAAGKRFKVSTDNLNGFQADRQTFTCQVKSAVEQYLTNGFPPRAKFFIEGLHQMYKTPTLRYQDFVSEFDAVTN